MNAARQRHERQIKACDPRLGRKFEDAVSAVVFRGGLSWFTDAQVAEIRELMIWKDWYQRRLDNQSRAIHRDAVAQLTGAAS